MKENIANHLKFLGAVAGSFISFFIGETNGTFIALLALMIIDYISGIIKAIAKKKLNSEVGAKGIAKKVFIILLVSAGNLVDVYILGEGTLCRTAVIGFYIVNESISVLENASEIGLKLPNKLVSVLEQLKDNEK